MTELKFTGVVENNLYLYKDKNGKKHWLKHAKELITTAPPPAKEAIEIDNMQKKLEKQKRESDYHKRRYQLMKEGKWKGSMPKD